MLRVACSGCGREMVFDFKAAEQQLFHCFGDESAFRDTVVYAILVLHDADLSAAESFVSELKGRISAKSDAIHCRILFNSSARAKTTWTALADNDVFRFLIDAVARLREFRPMYSLCAVNRGEYPSVHEAGAGLGRTVMESKQLAALLFQGAAHPLLERLGLANVRLWVDPDRTKIPWFGKNVQAHTNYKSEDLVSEQMLMPQTIPNGQKPVLLEIADVAAYAAAHALSSAGHPHKAQFEALYRMCRPELKVFTWDPEGIRVPSVLDKHHARIMST